MKNLESPLDLLMIHNEKLIEMGIITEPRMDLGKSGVNISFLCPN